MKYFYFFLVIFSLYKSVLAQPHIETLRDNSGKDFVQPSIVAYPEESYIVAGTLVDTYGHSQMAVVKTNDAGAVLWSKVIPDEQDSFVGSLIVDDEENIVLIGYRGINNLDIPNKDLRILKLDGQGNFVDEAIINDSDLNYGLYGFDLVQTDSGDYLITGVGTHGATETANKYGFVLRIKKNLSIIKWGRRYLSNNAIRKYDTFNHILKITGHSLDEELYLLTGSGATPNHKMMATNDLIDGSGNSAWGGAVGHYYSSGDYINPGRMALYQKATHDFYILSYGAENMPALLRLDSNGNGYRPLLFHNHFWSYPSDNINLVNGMRWANNQQDRILLTGYHIQPFVPPGQAWPMMINIALSSNQENYWVKYSSFFDGNDFQNINFDFMVKPINFIQPSASYMRNQLYYQPKSVITDPVDSEFGLKFVEPNQDSDNSQFHVNFLNMIDFEESADCATTFKGGQGGIPSQPLTAYTNFISFNHYFSIEKEQSVVENANITTALSCLSNSNKKTNQESSKKTSVLVYPNPASKFLYLDNLPEIGKLGINLYNLQGKQVLNKSYQNYFNQIQLDISNLQNGIYFIEVQHTGKTILINQVIKK